jgi:hypothetical protein
MVLRRVCWLVLLFAASMHVATAGDFMPLDHGLRYVGRDGIIPVTVEVTLRQRPDGAYEYAQWAAPRSWASWFGRTTVLRSRLQFRDDLLVALEFDDGRGAQPPPAGLAPGTLDVLAVRLRARADIARGLKHAEYTVWTGDDASETWTLEVNGSETVQTPDGAYQSLKFRLGSATEWIEGWSAPLLVFHFVRIDTWRDGKKVGELGLDDKQL